MILYGDITHDSRVRKEASTLVQQGWRVIVLCIVFDFMPHLALEEEIDGYTVKRILAQDKPKLQKFISIITQASRYLRKLNARIYHAHDFSGLVPLAFAGLWHKAFVYDSHELFFERGDKTIWDYLRPIEKFMAQRAQATITVNDSIAGILAKSLEIPKPIILRNVVDLRSISNQAPLSYNVADKKIIVHSGGITYGRNLPELVSALKYLPEEFVLVLMGKGVLEASLLEQAKIDNTSDRLKIISAVRPHEVVPTLSQADIGIALMASNVLNNVYSLPNKFFEAIAAGLPVLTSPNPELKRVIEHYDIGLTCDPSDPEVIANSIQKMSEPETYQTFKSNIENARSDLNWENEEKKLIKIYQAIVSDDDKE
ncbi:MAG: glycosyltransferase [Phototrophicaceae bacterium]